MTADGKKCASGRMNWKSLDGNGNYTNVYRLLRKKFLVDSIVPRFSPSSAADLQFQSDTTLEGVQRSTFNAKGLATASFSRDRRFPKARLPPMSSIRMHQITQISESGDTRALLDPLP